MDHLSQIAREAREHGMSYGKYVAMLREREMRAAVKPPPPPPEPEDLTVGIACGWCGTYFLPAHYNTKYCCKKCATRAHNFKNQMLKRKKQEKEANAIC